MAFHNIRLTQPYFYLTEHIDSTAQFYYNVNCLFLHDCEAQSHSSIDRSTLPRFRLRHHIIEFTSRP